jgi:CheY-like chemotaxis protein
MLKKMTRRRFLKGTFGALLTTVAASSGGYTYAHQIEPTLLDIQSLQIKHSLIPKSFDGIKLVQFSDTHLGFQYDLYQLKKLVAKINALHPDIITLDFNMPGMNGFETIEKLKEWNSQSKIIVISGEDEIALPENSNVIKWLRKPFNLLEFIKMFKEIGQNCS